MSSWMRAVGPGNASRLEVMTQRHSCISWASTADVCRLLSPLRSRPLWPGRATFIGLKPPAWRRPRQQARILRASRRERQRELKVDARQRATHFCNASVGGYCNRRQKCHATLFPCFLARARAHSAGYLRKGGCIRIETCGGLPRTKWSRTTSARRLSPVELSKVTGSMSRGRIFAPPRRRHHL
jgi:hypothetical protein